MESTQSVEGNKHKPICCIVVGMAGSGKTTLMQRMIKTAFDNNKTPYILNLDPAVAHLPYSCNIDIRDSVNYKGVMKDYKLGPNGSIMTSLNLFATRFDQVLNYIESKSDNLDYVFVDTPGQIEVFTWSASGEIITNLLSSSLPTVLIYVVDTPRSSQPVTFMSNMLYACSIFYRLCLPILVVFNKTDVESADKIDRWMRDYNYFHECISQSHSDSFIMPLTHSLALSLDEFYNTMTSVSVSSVTGEGTSDLFASIQASAEEYMTIYLPERKRRMEERQNQLKVREEQQIEAAHQDMKEDINAERQFMKDHPTYMKTREIDQELQEYPYQHNDFRNRNEMGEEENEEVEEKIEEENEMDEQEEEEYQNMLKYIDQLKKEQLH